MKFPRDGEYKVSRDAINIIGNLLQEKEYRLSSKKYLLNDHRDLKRDPGLLNSKYAGPNTTDYKGRFVYPEDATDIKSHPFFNRIAWDRHHLTRPPFVPDICSRDDTKYFDEEDPISDVDDADSQMDEDTPEPGSSRRDAGKQPARHLDGASAQCDHAILPAAVDDVNVIKNEGKRRRDKGKKRPRDKVLRDKEIGRKALELRKKGVFIGYTYRRPKLISFDVECGKQRHARRSLLPDFEKDR